MRSSLFILLKLMLLLLPAAAAAQGFHLEVLDRVALPVASTGLNVGGFKSDSSGHVFFAPAARDTRGMLSSPNTIVRVSADKAVRFLLSDIPEARRASIEDFSPGTNGDLFVITTTHIGIGKMESYVVHFDSDGKYVSKNRIELAGFIPSQIAVFGSGDFLLAGWRLYFADSSDANRRPFTGVFNSRGQLLATLRLAGDIKKETAVDDFEEAISLSMAETGADGYVYFARAAANGPVFVISPSGRVVRTIPVSAPKGMKLVGMKPPRGGWSSSTRARYQKVQRPRRSRWWFSIVLPARRWLSTLTRAEKSEMPWWITQIGYSRSSVPRKEENFSSCVRERSDLVSITAMPGWRRHLQLAAGNWRLS
jgi:hypothetical protein